MGGLKIKNKKVLVVGAARTGLAVGRFLVRRGAQVTLADQKTEQQLGKVVGEANGLGIELAAGPHQEEVFASSDLVVVSPGVPHTIDLLNDARRAGIPVIGEIELAGRFIEEPIVAITGTNGKTTTTRLVGEMLQASGHDVYVGGNIGTPLIDYVDQEKRADIVVAEVSSFQLDTIETFRPRVGVLLNISEDHLDRYEDFTAYLWSKARLFENQGEADFAVLNWSDPNVRQAGSGITASALYFNRASNGAPSAWMRGRELVCTMPDRKPIVLDMTGFGLQGIHNLENASAAALAALAAGAKAEGVQRALRSFQGLRHRVEYVRTINGVRYYNDSKGTNVGAVVKALESFDAPVVLIMGGRDKGGDYAPLKYLVESKVKRLVVIGEARGKILAVLGGLTSSEKAQSLEDAVRQASLAAGDGDVVLLSPGCSSFDMFSDYTQRGDVFREAVEQL